MRYPDDLLIGYIRPRHSELIVLTRMQTFADVLQLQRRQRTELSLDTTDHVVIEVPRFVQISVFASLLEWKKV